MWFGVTNGTNATESGYSMWELGGYSEQTIARNVQETYWDWDIYNYGAICSSRMRMNIRLNRNGIAVKEKCKWLYAISTRTYATLSLWLDWGWLGAEEGRQEESRQYLCACLLLTINTDGFWMGGLWCGLLLGVATRVCLYAWMWDVSELFVCVGGRWRNWANRRRESETFGVCGTVREVWIACGSYP